MHQAFVVGMASTALALTPALPALADSPPPPHVVNLEHWAKQFEENGAAEELPGLAEQVHAEYMAAFEDALDGIGAQRDAFSLLGQDLDDLFGSLSGRPRQHGELTLSLKGQLEDHPIQTKLADGKDVVLDRIASLSVHDLRDPVQALTLDPVAGEALAFLFDRAEWSVLSLSGNAQTKTFHTLILQPREELGLGSDVSVVVPVASVDPDNIPPDGSGFNPLASYGAGWCVFFALVTAILLSWTFWAIGACAASILFPPAAAGTCTLAATLIFGSIYAVDHLIANCGLTQPPSYHEFRAGAAAAGVDLDLLND